jgi:xanthine dehydrogenase YagT iron-sulfur-binding subunit
MIRLTCKDEMDTAVHPDPVLARSPAAPDYPLSCTVNGAAVNLQVESWVTLLDLLRERLALTGTKKGCDHGQCGACTVLVNGKRINSCLTLAVMQNGRDIVTVEGLAQGEELHPLQRAFISHDAFQCGYCTPGQLCSAVGMMDEIKAEQQGAPVPAGAGTNAAAVANKAGNRAQVRELMSGNICRCGAYPQIVNAVCAVLRDDMRDAGGEAGAAR